MNAVKPDGALGGIGPVTWSVVVALLAVEFPLAVTAWLELALAVPLGAVPLGAISVGAISVGTISVGTIAVGAIIPRFELTRAIPLRAIIPRPEFARAIPLRPIALRAIPLGAIPLGTIPMRTVVAMRPVPTRLEISTGLELAARLVLSSWLELTPRLEFAPLALAERFAALTWAIETRPLLALAAAETVLGALSAALTLWTRSTAAGTAVRTAIGRGTRRIAAGAVAMRRFHRPFPIAPAEAPAQTLTLGIHRSTGRDGSAVHCDMEPSYIFVCLWCRTSDMTNQSAAAAWPVPQ